MTTELDFVEEYNQASSMKAIGITNLPEIRIFTDLIELIDVPVPRPEDDEVAIKVLASTIHIDEIHIVQGTAMGGRFMEPKNVSKNNPHIPGSIVSGVVVATGTKVTKFSIGDEVVDIISNPKAHNSWAEYKCVAEKLVIAKPDKMTHNEAAALTIAAAAAKGAIDSSDASSDSKCLVVGGSGAIGSMVVQYLKALGAHVTAVCSGKNEELVKSLGADEVIDYTKDNFKDIYSNRNEQMDVVVDCVGGLEIEKDAFAVLKKTGRFITLVGPVKYVGDRRLSVMGITKMMLHISNRFLVTRFSGPRYIWSVKSLTKKLPEAMRLAVEHKMYVPIERTIPLEVEAISEAIELITSHRTRGRVVIEMG